MPVVSVVIPVFNTAEYLPEALESICAQTLSDLEVICVDDASTDDSRSVLAEWAAREPRVQVIAQPENRGPGAARNLALTRAAGRYVYFFDSDDVLAPSALANLVDQAEQDSLDMVLFNAVPLFDGAMNEERRAAYTRQYARSGEYAQGVSGPEMVSAMGGRLEWKPSPCLYLTRRELLEQRGLRFTEGLLHEDNGFTMRTMLSATAVGYDPSEYFARRLRDGSIMMRTLDFRHLRGLACAAAELCEAPGAVLGAAPIAPELASIVEIQAELIYYDAASKFDRVSSEAQQRFRDWKPESASVEFVRRRVLERVEAQEALAALARLEAEHARLTEEVEQYRNSRALKLARLLRGR